MVASAGVVALVTVLTELVVLTITGAALAGTGAGLLSYRVVFGVIRPLPECRLDGANERSV